MAKETQLIDLDRAVPPSAIRVMLEYSTTSETDALLYRFQDDQRPLVLHPPSGRREVNLCLGRRLHLEAENPGAWKVRCTGFRVVKNRNLADLRTPAWVRRSGLVWPTLGVLAGIAISSLYWTYVAPPDHKMLEFFTAVAPMLAVVVALAALIVNLRQSRFSMGIDLLTKLSTQFQSADMQARRARAAKHLKNEEITDDSDVIFLLDFFENIGLLARRGAIDTELIWHTFSYWFAFYFQITARYRARCRNEDPTWWEDVERLWERLNEQGFRHGAPAPSIPMDRDAPLTSSQIAFLEEEIRLVAPRTQ